MKEYNEKLKKELEEKIMWYETDELLRSKFSLNLTPESIVAVRTPASKYKFEELSKLVEFSETKTDEYDSENDYRSYANPICVDKLTGDNRALDGWWLIRYLVYHENDPKPIVHADIDKAITKALKRF